MEAFGESAPQFVLQSCAILHDNPTFILSKLTLLQKMTLLSSYLSVIYTVTSTFLKMPFVIDGQRQTVCGKVIHPKPKYSLHTGHWAPKYNTLGLLKEVYNFVVSQGVKSYQVLDFFSYVNVKHGAQWCSSNFILEMEILLIKQHLVQSIGHFAICIKAKLAFIGWGAFCNMHYAKAYCWPRGHFVNWIKQTKVFIGRGTIL